MNELHLGPYIVRLGMRADNPAFPAYLIFRGDKLIGKQFSYPTLDDCRALERNAPSPCATRKSRYGRNDEVTTRQCLNCSDRFVPRQNGTVYCAACRLAMRKAA